MANNKSKINVSSTKSQIGHLLGAAGGVEAVYSILCLINKKAPYNLNLECEIESHNINFLKEKPLDIEINNILSNSFGFGGTNVSLILSKYVGLGKLHFVSMFNIILKPILTLPRPQPL